MLRRGDILKGDISPRRPVQSGDTLYVANIYVLGGTLPKIQKTLKLLQDKQIHLRIPSLEYDDKDDTHDHELLSGTTVSRSLSSSVLVTEKLLEDRNVVYL